MTTLTSSPICTLFIGYLRPQSKMMRRSWRHSGLKTHIAGANQLSPACRRVKRRVPSNLTGGLPSSICARTQQTAAHHSQFGTSFGISTIYLAAAVRDNRNNGRLITTELSAKKANRARQNVVEAGLSNVVEIREGDAFETLRGEMGEPIELLLLDGWKSLYPPLLELLESRLSAGALIIADDLNIAAEALKSYLQDVSDPVAPMSFAEENQPSRATRAWSRDRRRRWGAPEFAPFGSRGATAGLQTRSQ